MLHRTINYFVERFGYLLVCSVINDVIINAVKHHFSQSLHFFSAYRLCVIVMSDDILQSVVQ